MIISPPPSWKEVAVPDFETYLAACPDYVRDAYCGAAVYKFRHSGKEFGYVKVHLDNVERVYVDPKLLQ